MLQENNAENHQHTVHKKAGESLLQRFRVDFGVSARGERLPWPEGGGEQREEDRDGETPCRARGASGDNHPTSFPTHPTGTLTPREGYLMSSLMLPCRRQSARVQRVQFSCLVNSGLSTRRQKFSHITCARCICLRFSRIRGWFDEPITNVFGGTSAGTRKSL